MASTSMPQRQTYPHIKGRVEDAIDVIDFTGADLMELLVEVDAQSDLFILTATAINPASPTSIFVDEDGVERGANFQAVIGNSGMSTDVAVLRAKLKVTWDSASTPPAVQFMPNEGFMTVTITENVQVDP